MGSQLTPPTLAPVLLTSEQGSARWKNESQLWGATVSTLAMKYGVENEPVARETFATSFINKGISCVDTGMWVNGRYPDIC